MVWAWKASARPIELVILIGLGAGASQGIGAIEYDVAYGWLEPCACQQSAERDAPPFADAAPPFDAVVPRDLGAGRHGAQLGE